MTTHDNTGRSGRVSMTMVAELAGVSQKTVSRVINSEPHVKREVRERVEEAIRTSGYRPNAAARALVTKRSRRIGAVACGASWHGPNAQVAAVERAVRNVGYTLAMTRAEGADPAVIQEAIDRLADDGAEGVILVEPLDLGEATLHAPQGSEFLTFGDSPVTDSAREQCVGRDERSGAFDVTEHLLALGHGTVHHVAGPATWISSRLRVDGWRRALEESGIPIPATIEADWSPRGGFDAMNRLLKNGGCTAVFAANDQMAIGAMRAVELAGLRVPDDVSVAGFDDLDVAEYLAVPLTTVKQDFDETARIGVHRLIRAIEGQPLAPTPRLIPAPLVVRASSMRPPRSSPPRQLVPRH
jgi:DNA-binding LacI/PurR family transcriptional regulator